MRDSVDECRDEDFVLYDFIPSVGSESRVWTAGTNTPQSALRYRFGGKEIAGQKVSVSTGAPAAAAGSPYLDFGARVYDPRTAAWLSQDPLSEKYYSISPYAYCAGDPVNLVDYNGLFIGDYYNTSGNYIGTDGIDDKMKYLVLSPEDQKTVKKNNKNGGSTPISALSSAVPVPSNEIVDMMDKAYEITEKNGLEHGFRAGQKGTISTIVEGNEGEIDMTGPQNEIIAVGDYTALDVHTHPMGNPFEYGEAKPSTLDRTNALVTANNVVLGYEWIPSSRPNTIGGAPSFEPVRRIGYYDKIGLIGKSLRFDTYKRAVNKINKKR